MYLFVYSFPTNLYYYYARSQVWHHFQRPSKNYSKRKKSFFSYSQDWFNAVFFTFDRLVNPPWKLVLIPFFCRLLWYVFELRRTMIIRGDWLWKPTNIKVENNGAFANFSRWKTVATPYHRNLNRCGDCYFLLQTLKSTPAYFVQRKFLDNVLEW